MSAFAGKKARSFNTNLATVILIMKTLIIYNLIFPCFLWAPLETIITTKYSVLLYCKEVMFLAGFVCLFVLKDMYFVFHNTDRINCHVQSHNLEQSKFWHQCGRLVYHSTIECVYKINFIIYWTTLLQGNHNIILGRGLHSWSAFLVNLCCSLEFHFTSL